MTWATWAVSVGALAVAALSLWVTYRSRALPYRQKVWEKQLDASTEVLLTLGRLNDDAQEFLARPPDGRPPGTDLRGATTEVRKDFFVSYRRWGVLLPQSVAQNVGTYLRALEDADRGPRRDTDPAIDVRLMTAYTAVVAAARDFLSVDRLSKDNLDLLGTLPITGSDKEPFDPLYIKVEAERPVFDHFEDEGAQTPEPTPGRGTVDEGLRADRNALYVGHRNLFLVHTWRPSPVEGQLADISIRLTEHTRRGSTAGQPSFEKPLSNKLVTRVEFELGTSFGRTFTKTDADEEFKLDISVYGPTLCLARVHFSDTADPLELYRYLDFLEIEPSSATDQVI